MVLSALIFIIFKRFLEAIFLLHHRIRIYLIFAILTHLCLLNNQIRGKYFFVIKFIMDFSIFKFCLLHPLLILQLISLYYILISQVKTLYYYHFKLSIKLFLYSQRFQVSIIKIIRFAIILVFLSIIFFVLLTAVFTLKLLFSLSECFHNLYYLGISQLFQLHKSFQIF